MSRLLEQFARFFPRSFREWVIRKLRSGLFRDGVPRSSLPIDAIKYLPHESAFDSYVIMKEEHDPERCRYGLPIPPKDLWLGYGADTEEYLSLGEGDVRLMLEALRETGFVLAPGNRVLDFGCASGRMMRHLAEYSQTCEIWGTDINARILPWCQRNLSPPFQFAITTTVPHLPFEDRYFNLVYVGSVFTHIEDLTRAWLLELRRIIVPEGRLFVTIHDGHTMKLLEPQYIRDRLTKVIEQTGQRPYEWRRFSRGLEQNADYQRWKDKPFAMMVLGRDAASQVFYDIDFFYQLVRPMFEPLLVREEVYGYQTGIVLRRMP